jgi:hypothetical protein
MEPIPLQDTFAPTFATFIRELAIALLPESIRKEVTDPQKLAYLIEGRLTGSQVTAQVYLGYIIAWLIKLRNRRWHSFNQPLGLDYIWNLRDHVAPNCVMILTETFGDPKPANWPRLLNLAQQLSDFLRNEVGTRAPANGPEEYVEETLEHFKLRYSDLMIDRLIEILGDHGNQSVRMASWTYNSMIGYLPNGQRRYFSLKQKVRVNIVGLK